MNFPNQQYSVIYADPPWAFKLYSSKGEEKSPQAHYNCMPLEAIKQLPVMWCAAQNSVLFMWATFPMLPEAIEVMEAWGFQYKSGAAWHKKTTHGKTAFGTGYIFRSAAELLLVGTHGDPHWKSKNVRNVIETPVRENSRKPDSCYGMIEQMVDGPYLELFARQRRAGWDSWGNEVDKFTGAA